MKMNKMITTNMLTWFILLDKYIELGSLINVKPTVWEDTGGCLKKPISLFSGKNRRSITVNVYRYE